MPTGVYIRTETHRLINSESHKGKLPWNTGKKGIHLSPQTEFKKGQLSSKRGRSYEDIYGVEKARELKNKNSIGHKGQHSSPQTEFKDGQTPWNKGLPCSEELINKLSEINKGQVPWNTGKRCPQLSESKKGKNNPNWKGGITPEVKNIRNGAEYNLWKDSVFMRDDYTCQKCNKKGSYLHAHHIQNFSQFPELRFDVDNGITFCEEHHKEFHDLYGRENNNQKQIIEFLKGKDANGKWAPIEQCMQEDS
jgi:hypothetical protein